MDRKLLLIMIDGVGADYLSEYGQFMPNTRALAESGTVFARLPPEKCGSSLPGRAAILTGCPSREHGVYGNMIRDPATRGFRYATPYDVRADSLFTHARRAGLDTASVGFGMVRPEDCSIYLAPFWVGDFVGRNRDDRPLPLTPGWRRGLETIDDGRLGLAEEILGYARDTGPVQLGASVLEDMAQDLKMIQRVNQIIACEHPPDLVFTEINITDSVQHTSGYGTIHAHAAIAWADMLVGLVLENLEACGLRDQFTVVVTSDHGHGNTAGAVYADRIAAAESWSSECAILFLENSNGIGRTLDAFYVHGARIIDNDFLPRELRQDLAVLALDGARSFETAPASIRGLTGPSRYASSHSYPPGTRSDDRFAVVSGPGVRPQLIEQATSEQVYLLMAETLGLDP